MKTFWTWCETQASWWGSHGLVWWAGHLTAVYVGLIILVVAARFDELLCLPLNALGDFSAGAFGPIAFLWLVLGYKQQGEELAASSAALKEQAKELKNSIDLQRLNAEKQDLMLDPVFYLNYAGPKNFNGHSLDTLVITNKGDTCRDVYVVCGSESVPAQNRYTHVLGRDMQFDFDIYEVARDTLIAVVISYVRANGSKSRQGFQFIKPTNGVPKTFAFPIKNESP